MDPNSAGPIYCAEQIVIPPTLPDILKEFTKAAIRTQPPDLLQWAAAYFQALTEGEVPPVKDHIEQVSDLDRLGGLSKGVLTVLHKQLSQQGVVAVTTLREKWKDLGCSEAKLNELLTIGDFADEVDWLKLLCLACTALENSLPEALCRLCEVLSPDEGGGAARVPLDQFRTLYSYLASVDGEVPVRQVEEVMEFLGTEAERNNGTVGPREFLHSSCPRLVPSLH